MLKDFLEVFEKELNKHGDKIILDDYILADGTYIIVESDKNLEFKIQSISEIKYNKKIKELITTNNEVLEKLKIMDYNSCLININKSIDSKKKIHSNNYLSFFVKKQVFLEKTLTKEIIDSYYSILENPSIKYKDKKSKLLYENIERQIGKINIERLKKIKKWIKENIFDLEIDRERKDYLKIFFDFGIEEFESEGKRYLIPNIYNKNDYNIEQNREIYGLPNDNMSLNYKKPYLENKTRYEKVPYLIGSNEVLLQKKAFDYLMNFASKEKYNVFFDEEKIVAKENGEVLEKNFLGQFMRIQKEKELNIIFHDIISSYKYNLKKPFNFKNVLRCSENSLENIDYGLKNNKTELQSLLDDILFSKFLINNYFSDIKELKVKNNDLKINLEFARESIFNWIYKDDISTVCSVLDKVTKRCIRDSISNGYILKACNQFNLRYSILDYFKENENMTDRLFNIKNSLKEKINENNIQQFSCDIEYYFAVGQLINYLEVKSKLTLKKQIFINHFIDMKNNKAIKDRLSILYRKYNYDMKSSEKRIRNIYAMVDSYNAETKINQEMIIAGYLHNNLIFEKRG